MVFCNSDEHIKFKWPFIKMLIVSPFIQIKLEFDTIGSWQAKKLFLKPASVDKFLKGCNYWQKALKWRRGHTVSENWAPQLLNDFPCYHGVGARYPPVCKECLGTDALPSSVSPQGMWGTDAYPGLFTLTSPPFFVNTFNMNMPIFS